MGTPDPDFPQYAGCTEYAGVTLPGAAQSLFSTRFRSGCWACDHCRPSEPSTMLGLALALERCRQSPHSYRWLLSTVATHVCAISAPFIVMMCARLQVLAIPVVVWGKGEPGATVTTTLDNLHSPPASSPTPPTTTQVGHDGICTCAILLTAFRCMPSSEA
jgi:hypothetical protein